MPVWHEKTRPWVEQGKLVVLGITQEQHPARCRLFAQWKKFDWPILHDPINVLQLTAVPVLVAIDEHGVVRSTRPNPETFEADFLDRTFPAPAADVAKKPAEPAMPDLAALRREAVESRSAAAWRRLGDATVLWAPAGKINDAIDAYTRAIRLAPDDGDAHFRLGVCYRIRYESSQRVGTDFQSAVNQWTRAREIGPNQYIWRRRIEQYGPRLIKPYPFYDWITDAIDQIAARGEKPVALRVELSGAEIAQPSRTFVAETKTAEGKNTLSPDPTGRILRDTGRLIVAEVAVVPPRIKPGESARVHVTLRPSDAGKAHWNNEAEPLRLWIDTPDGWQLQQQLLTAPQGNKPETAEPRHLEFEVRAGANASGPTQLRAYALYSICEEVGGMCLFRRQDIPITVTVGERMGYQVELTDPVSPTTPARVYDVALTRDRNGFPVEYTLSFETHVCTDNQCEVVEVTMVWNALGSFERLRCPPGKPLTKKEHVPFTAEDYAKLDRILKERGSILGTWTLAFLERPVGTDGDVDAVTGPTPINVQQSVIEEAAYTTWALWNWANGEIVSKLRRITEQHCTPTYLNHLLGCEDRRHADFALDYVMEHHPSDPRFVEGVFHILDSGETDQIVHSLEFLSRAIPDKRRLHARLIESCCLKGSAACPMILQKLAAEPDLPAATLEGLTGRLTQFPYFPIHLILRMLEERKFVSKKTMSDVAALLDSDDFFIARRAYEHLAKHDLDADTENKFNAFGDRNRDRL